MNFYFSDNLFSSTWHCWLVAILIIPLVTCKDARLARRIFSSIIGTLEQVLFSITVMPENGASVTILAATML